LKEVKSVAKSVVIKKGDNNTEVYIDDVEICDVISYELSENSNIATLKIEICITGEIEVNLQ
ncbi:hypothetical protein, partial [Anaerotignum faecicola]|uniref:hypothetical protein n=1 Tax=Anaerotignum faecicola TaxID=2358141 RepID=UPI003FD7AA57